MFLTQDAELNVKPEQCSSFHVILNVANSVMSSDQLHCSGNSWWNKKRQITDKSQNENQFTKPNLQLPIADLQRSINESSELVPRDIKLMQPLKHRFRV